MFRDARDLLDADPVPGASALAVADLGEGCRTALVVGCGRGPNRLLACRDGRLQPEPWTELADPGGAAAALAAADLDGDGVEEVYVGNAAGADRLFKRSGRGFRDLFDGQADGLVNRLPGAAVLPLDRSGNGRYGFLVGTRGGPLRLFEEVEPGRLDDLAPAALLDELTEGGPIGAAPLVSPGADVVVAGRMGSLLCFQPQGGGRYGEIARPIGLGQGGHGQRSWATSDLAVLDVNGDGLFDLLLAGPEHGHRLFVQSDLGAFGPATPAPLAWATRAAALVVADFDNDGHEEIFVAAKGEPNRLLTRRDGSWRPADPGDAMEPTSSPSAAGALDVDDDGRLELLLTHPEGRGLTCYRPTPNDHAWLRVRPRTAAGAPARGAVVRLKAGGRQQLRIVGNAGGVSRMEPVAHFGLGTTEAVDWVEVRWPGGQTVRIDRPAVRQTLEPVFPGAARMGAARQRAA